MLILKLKCNFVRNLIYTNENNSYLCDIISLLEMILYDDEKDSSCKTAHSNSRLQDSAPVNAGTDMHDKEPGPENAKAYRGLCDLVD